MLILLLSQYFGQRHLAEILSLKSKTNMCLICSLWNTNEYNIDIDQPVFPRSMIRTIFLWYWRVSRFLLNVCSPARWFNLIANLIAKALVGLAILSIKSYIMSWNVHSHCNYNEVFPFWNYPKYNNDSRLIQLLGRSVRQISHFMRCWYLSHI